MKKLLLLAALVFVAGCVGGQNAKADVNNGVIIERFTVNPSAIFDFQTSMFSIDIANVGGTTARNVVVKLLGVEGIWRDTSGSHADSSDVTRPSSGTITLNPPRLKDNVAGDSRFFDFTLIGPDLNEGDSATFPVKARVEFIYDTSASAIIKAISLSRFGILQAKGEAVADPLKESNSDGPVKFRLVRGTVPLVIDPDEDSTSIDREFRFEIVNVGDGWPMTRNAIGQNVVGLVGGTISLRAPAGITLRSCDGFTSGVPTSFLATLRSDGKAQISCSINIPTQQWRTRTEESIDFDVLLQYGYFVESDVSVNVQGTKRGATPFPTAFPTATAMPTPVPVQAPSVTFKSVLPLPSVLEWHNKNFVATFRYQSTGSQLDKCEYRVQPTFISAKPQASCTGSGPVDLDADVEVELPVGTSAFCNEGVCSVIARIMSKDGQTASMTQNFNVDVSKPQVQIITTAATVNTEVNIQATVLDSISGLQRCELTADGTTKAMAIDNADPATCKETSPCVASAGHTFTADGDRDISVKCIDLADNERIDSGTIVVS